MSESDGKEIEREIVIVRRGGRGEEEGHHGGVWKIAYADFMTAMMAFFLVMWLVNATDEETKALVASYFNPIELMDEKPADRSVQDQGTSSEGETNKPAADTQGEGISGGAAAEEGSEENATAGRETAYSEADYFRNPYAVLSEIALETGQQANVSEAGAGGAQISGPATGAQGGEAYRDPFDPDFWSQQTTEPMIDPSAVPGEAAAETSTQAEEADAAAPALSGSSRVAEEDDDAAVETEMEIARRDLPVREDQDMSSLDETVPSRAADGAAASAEASPPDPDAVAVQARQLETEIEKAIAGVNGRLAEGLDVQAAEGGVLISLTDQINYAMFNVGSAVPRRDMVLAMEEIGKLLAGRKGDVVLRGHTDARPFAGGTGNNWSLSTDRAQSAYHMLVRGGLPEERVVQVSGFADRRLKLPDDPFADANRRIEILVQGMEAR